MAVMTRNGGPNFRAGQTTTPEEEGLSIYNGPTMQFTPRDTGMSRFYSYGMPISNPFANGGSAPSGPPEQGGSVQTVQSTQLPAAPVTGPAPAGSPLTNSIYNGQDMQFVQPGTSQWFTHGIPTQAPRQPNLPNAIQSIPQYQRRRSPAMGSPLLNAIRGY